VAQWATPSLAPGWTVRDVVLHLAQGEEMAVARLSGAPNPAAHDPVQAQHDQHSQQAQHGQDGRTVEQIMAALVEADPATPAQALRRWQQARGAAMDLLRAADPQRRIEWAAAPLKPAALATTRLAEHWTTGWTSKAAGATGAGLRTSGPDGARALGLLRSYAV
jgi:hypothetical protein